MHSSSQKLLLNRTTTHLTRIPTTTTTTTTNKKKKMSGVVVVRAQAVAGVAVKQVPTKPIEGQKTGTSGLRKKAKEFSSENYLANWVQSLFLALPQSELQGSEMVLGGDGRWFNKEASQIILKLVAGNGVKKMYVGQNGYLATPT